MYGTTKMTPSQHAATLDTSIRSCVFEPTLDEALADPIVQLVLARDGLTSDDVRKTLEPQRRRLLARRPVRSVQPC